MSFVWITLIAIGFFVAYLSNREISLVRKKNARPGQTGVLDGECVRHPRHDIRVKRPKRTRFFPPPKLQAKKAAFEAREKLLAVDPDFADAVSAIESLTRNPWYQRFAFNRLYLGNNFYRDVGINTGRVEKFLRLFSEQLDRENREVPVDPLQGWSIQHARKLVLPTARRQTGFYFPERTDLTGNWRQSFAPDGSLEGEAGFVNRICWTIHANRMDKAATAIPITDRFLNVTEKYIERVTGCPLPEELASLRGTHIPVANFNIELPTGHKFQFQVIVGMYWTDRDYGTARATLSI